MADRDALVEEMAQEIVDLNRRVRDLTEAYHVASGAADNLRDGIASALGLHEHEGDEDLLIMLRQVLP